LFIWAVFFNRIPTATIFWRGCKDQIGSALVASLMLTKMARKATTAGKLHLADELDVNAGLVISFCCSCFVIRELGAKLSVFWAKRTTFVFETVWFYTVSRKRNNVVLYVTFTNSNISF